MFKPTTIPQLSLSLTVVDSAKSIEFYRDAFGFIVKSIARDEKDYPIHVAMTKQDAYIMFSPEGAYGSTQKSPINLGVRIPVNIYVYCEDVDSLYRQAISAGAKTITEPQDSFWGDRFCSILDIDNYEWSFATLLKK